jgi:acetyltransferase-like isoleucine patch superfamily enzyme
VNSFARTIRDMDTLAMDNPITPLVGATVDQNTHTINRIPSGMFDKCRDVTLGVGVVIEDGVRFMCDKVTIGDFVYIGRGTTIRTPDFSIGDYTRLNEASYCGGRKPLRIGRNVYLGRGVYLDSNGGLTLEDNTLAGAYSQLWTHIEGGDMIQGCNPRWHQERKLVVERGAWLVGRVVVSHAKRIGTRALVLNESNVLHDIPADTTWAGNPAQDVTKKMGRQYEELVTAIAVKERLERLNVEVEAFETAYPQFKDHIKTFMWAHEYYLDHDQQAAFFADEQTYMKRRTAAEVAFMRFTSGKFTPAGEE